MWETLNPFRLPVHPMLVHFPIATLVLFWALLIVRYVTGDEKWDERARLLHVVGVATLPVAMVAALVDTRGIGFVTNPRWDAPLIWHAFAGAAAAAIFIAHFAWRRGRTPAQLSGRLAALDLAWAGAGLWFLVAVGLIAGEMVYAS
jgi:uncharacterized membrane protein